MRYHALSNIFENISNLCNEKIRQFKCGSLEHSNTDGKSLINKNILKISILKRQFRI